MARSIDRVKAALADAEIDAEIQTMPSSTRTAREAADACGCDVGQIVKSLIFEGVESGTLKLLLVSGRNQVDMALAHTAVGEPLQRADPRRVRDETGFAIGGVAPLGHKNPVGTWIDETLLTYGRVWAAAGAPNTVFCCDPVQLRDVTTAQIIKLA